MKIRVLSIFVLVILVLSVVGLWTTVRERKTSVSSSGFRSVRWNPAAAAQYLDSREVWWQSWPGAQMDHGTVCISCHTVVTYALVRPALRQELNEKGTTRPEQVMLASIEKRVNDWANTAPFYTDEANGPGKSAQSRATEAVLNAVILASYDAAQGHLSSVTRAAFDEAWALQETSGEDAGGWQWQDFHLAPWESTESAYQGAALFAVALGNAPDGYAANPASREHVELLEQYLRHQYAAQPVMSQLYVLWASRRMPELLTEKDRMKLIDKIENLQLSDGGWSLPSLDQQPGVRRYLLDYWKQISNTATSDGCATGLVVLALEENGPKPKSSALSRGLQWLEDHQAKDGKWWAPSLNGLAPQSDEGLFMSDAATGYAVLALQIAGDNRSADGSLATGE